MGDEPSPFRALNALTRPSFGPEGPQKRDKLPVCVCVCVCVWTPHVWAHGRAGGLGWTGLERRKADPYPWLPKDCTTIRSSHILPLPIPHPKSKQHTSKSTNHTSKALSHDDVHLSSVHVRIHAPVGRHSAQCGEGRRAARGGPRRPATTACPNLSPTAHPPHIDTSYLTSRTLSPSMLSLPPSLLPITRRQLLHCNCLTRKLAQ